MASAQMESIAKMMLAAPVPDGPPPDRETQRAGFESRAAAPRSDVRITNVSANGVNCDWAVAPNSDPGRRLLYLHGGGYTVGSNRSHRRIAGDIASATSCSVLVADYRLCPEEPFPAALDDALAAYRWMRENGPDGAAAPAATFIAGDSAGGGLTLALLVRLRELGESLPLGAITLSAWTDLAATGESLQSRAAVDPVFRMAAMIAMAGTAYAGTTATSHPLVSPLYADLAGLPPLLMQVGDNEILLDDTLRTAAKAKAAGVDVRLTVTQGAFHVYQFFAPETPESADAFREMGEFVMALAT